MADGYDTIPILTTLWPEDTKTLATDTTLESSRNTIFFGLFILLTTPGLLSQTKLQKFSSAHYDLHTDFPPTEAKQQLSVIESAWTQLGDFFGAYPPLAGEEQLQVFLFETKDSFDKKIRADDAISPGKSAGGYYWPPKKTVYQYRQPTIYYTRQLLLHECIHQFHFLSSTNNKSPRDNWYVEGVAEFLSRHFWDGRTLRLGIVPTITIKDFAAKALRIMSTPGYDLGALVSSQKKSTRAEKWALLHWLCRPDPKAKKKWRIIARALNEGRSATKMSRKIAGKSNKNLAPLVQWLRKNQEPMLQIFNQWEGIARHSIRGTSRVVSLCRTKKECDRFLATLKIPTTPRQWAGGLLLHWSDNSNYTLLLLRGKNWRIDRYVDRKWRDFAYGRTPMPLVNGNHELVARRSGESVEVSVNKKIVAIISLPRSTMGLALDNCTLTFDGVRWQ